ncbi:MAG: hypothetical protein APF81_14685 [Desulfosporosinus sp. BRH_c37]|nr:MAG: hypothetical protein APF81_14685 [Desulfosporosinus sp. BRH_c37]
MICLFLWQASFLPALGQVSDDTSENPINSTLKIVVQRGETLWELARNHHTRVDEIVKLNKVKDPDHIGEGESLWIPNKVVEEKTEKTEKTENGKIKDIIKLDNTFNPLWWVNALRKRVVQSTILTYEIFVNQETPDPPVIKTLPNDIDDVQKQTELKTATIGAEKQILSRSLGRLVSKEDVELLTRVIHGEARGENFEGQVAVGAVVLNRLKDPRFPKTIRAVVYQSGAFTAVDDKQIHLDPNDQSYKAAEAALSGLDPSNGALFYFNPLLATDHWIKNRPVIKRIGNHTFSI